MKISPVSFRSLIVFNIDNDRPQAGIKDLLRLSFNNNPKLKNYSLSDTFVDSSEPDGTVFNATKDFCEELDKRYADDLPKGSKKVFLTESEFFVSPKDKIKKYFLTAATNKDEEHLLNVFKKSTDFYVARFTKRK